MAAAALDRLASPPMRRSRPPIALAALLPLALLAGACGGDDDGAGGGGGDGARAVLGGGGLDTVSGALATLPAGGTGGSGAGGSGGGEPQAIAWGDLERAAEIAGIEVPDAADEDAVVDYVQVLTNGRVDAETETPVLVLPPADAGADRIAEIEDFTAEVGWNVLDVARFVERQTAPDTLTVIEGSIDEGALTEAMGDPVADGLWAAGDPEAEDFETDLDGITAARPLGQTLWMGFDGDLLRVARSRATAEGALALDGGTLADDDAYAGLAEGLDTAEVYGAMLVVPGMPWDPAGAMASPAQAERACQEALPEPTTGVATGIAEDGGPVYVVTLAHDSPDAAEANAAALEQLVAEGTSLVSRQAWSDLVTLDGVEVTGDGQVVVARLRPVESGPPALWYQMVVQRDSLVTSC